MLCSLFESIIFDSGDFRTGGPIGCCGCFGLSAFCSRVWDITPPPRARCFDWLSPRCFLTMSKELSAFMLSSFYFSASRVLISSRPSSFSMISLILLTALLLLITDLGACLTFTWLWKICCRFLPYFTGVGCSAEFLTEVRMWLDFAFEGGYN